jgi:EAL domain-containing protein (putative c-di-GMP-specific phosphodiesterase class I)
VVDARTPLCLICDEGSSIRHFLSLIMQGAGIDAEEFANGASMRLALAGKPADLIFIDVPLDVADPVQTISALSQMGFKGAVQLIGNRGTAAMEQVRQVGERGNVRMLPPLKKPLDLSVIQKVVKDLKIGLPPAVAARIRLDEALANNWVEFWFQPKINLRRKKLAGVEAFPRVRHPQYGILLPDTFMPGAQPPELTKFAELSIVHAIMAEQQFSSLGLHLPVTINVDAATLSTLPVDDIIRSMCADLDAWPGLIIDIPEVQIVNQIPLAIELDRKFSPVKVKLAMDDVGRGHAKLAKAEAAPFAEFKLDGLFVTKCADDKVNTPICKTVIGLAQRFGGSAAANGLAKAADIIALQNMGAVFGQGPLLGQPMSMERFTSLLRQRAAAQSRRSAA